MSSPARATAAQIRLFQPPEEPRSNEPRERVPPPPQTFEGTLSEAFEQLVAPDLTRRGRSKDTLSQYRIQLRRWDEFCRWRAAADDTWTTHPCVRLISRRDLRAFRGWLESHLRGANVARNVNKHVGGVEAILAWLAQRELIPSAASVEPLACRTAAPKLYLRREEVDALYAACGLATWPQRSNRGKELIAPVQWRAAICLFCNYGFRTQELVTFEADHQPLRWSQITFGAQTPAEDGRAENERGWLWYVPQKRAGKNDRPCIVPLNRHTRAHLDSVLGGSRLADVAERPVFDWPLCNKSFYGQWRRLISAARITPRQIAGRQTQREYTLYHLRKTCATWYEQHAGREVAEEVTGHIPQGVTGRHYSNLEEPLLRAVLSLPQPQSFDGIFVAPIERQRTLF